MSYYKRAKVIINVKEKGFTPLDSKHLMGFTLIEAVIVAALFSVVGITLLAAFSSGIKVWNRVYDKNEEEDISIFFEKISRDLRNSTEYNSIDFSGKETSVRFATFVSARSKFSGLSEGIGEVNYYWDKDNRKVLRAVRNSSDIYRDKEGLISEVLGNAGDFKLSYYFYDPKEKKYFWLDKWDKKEVPVSVRLSVSSSYDNKTISYRRTIEIPRGEIAD